jgi:hypothetical protein
MSTKDTLVGTTKQFVAEIVGDGRLAEEGSRQAAGTAPLTRRSETADHPQPDRPLHSEPSRMDENRFATLLGHAALKVWADLPRDAQERLFAAAVDDRLIANALAEFLHDRHPRTAHPPKPTRLA